MVEWPPSQSRRAVLGALAASLAGLVCDPARAQGLPSEDDIRRDLAAPGVVEIVFRGQGTLERIVENGVWIDEYKRSVTVRRAGDRPGVTVEVIGDVVYRPTGDRFVFQRMRLAGNRLTGLEPPDLAAIDRLIATLKPHDIDTLFSLVVGEYESIRLADDPRWEWHSPKSVSFEVVQIYTTRHMGGAYPGSYVEMTKPGEVFLDRVERIERWRIYRDAEDGPWLRLSASGHRVGTMIPRKGAPSQPAMRLLARRVVTEREFQAMPRATRVPALSPTSR